MLGLTNAGVRQAEGGVSGASGGKLLGRPANAGNPATLPALETTLYNFGATLSDAENPKGSLMQASDGNFYGISASGGLLVDGYYSGAIYQITPAGQESVIYSFTGGDDGCEFSNFPGNTPVEATDGNLYGTTNSCGTENGGTIWRYNLKTGVFSTVYEQPFKTTGGAVIASLIDGGNGTLYGVTADGDATETYYDGTVFAFDYTTNTLTILHSFSGADGMVPETALVLGQDGKLYGTASGNGTYNDGVVFSLDTDGSNFQVIHAFSQSVDGRIPTGVVQFSDGNLYGSTLLYGAGGNGEFFQITPNGASSSYKTIYPYQVTDGHDVGTPFLGGDGKFYIAGLLGGGNGWGQVMQIDSQGNKAVVFDFTPSTGRNTAALLESAGGDLYGVTDYGGTNSDGLAFKLSTSLPPAISLTPSANVVAPGSPVTLLWTAANAFSKNAQLCLASSSDGSWSGVVPFSGAASVSPTVSSGVVQYAITCGGVETALATVNIGQTGFVVTTTALPNGSIGVAYSAMLTAANGKTPYTWTIVSGALPQGLTLSGDGVITGEPVANGAGNFAVQVTDSTGATASASLGITVSATPLEITQANLPTGTAGAAYSQTFIATGGQAPYSWTIVSGSLPPGLSLAAGSGVVSGTPTRSGTFSFSVQVMDSESTSAIQIVKTALTINPAEPAFPASGSLLWVFPGSPTDGVQPAAGIMEASDGNFYGVTCCGGSFSGGTLYKMPATGVANKESTAAYFDVKTIGQGSNSTPIEAADGNLYGTTPYYGTNGGGSLYQYNLQTGATTVLYAFPKNAPGSYSDLIDDGNGMLYGTSSAGGTNGNGSVWSWNYKTQSFTTLYSFTGGNDGSGPWGGLVLASDGNLYGLTMAGGASSAGTAYMLGPDGSNFQVIHTFTNGVDGGTPTGELTQYSDGNLYGVTNTGGANSFGNFFQLIPKGSSSVLNPLYQFKSSDGVNVVGSDVYSGNGRPFIGGDGKFYVAGRWGGVNNAGQIMQLDAQGNKADVFDASGLPEAPPIEGQDGNLYGTFYLDAVYQVQTYLPPAIMLNAGVTDVAAGASVQLTWAVNNAFSKNAQVCIARSTDNSWTGQVAASGIATVTPTATGAVTYALTCGGIETAFLTINGDKPLVVETSSLASGTVDSFYSDTLTANGGTPPYLWSLASGSTLPQGVSLSPTGQISGTPLNAGTTSLQVQVADSEPIAQNVSANFSITIAPKTLSITTASLSNGVVGIPYSQPVGAIGGTAPYTWSITAGNLPAGLRLTPSSGLISGTPTAAGNSQFTVQVTDSAGTATSIAQSYTIVVQAQPPAVTTTSLPDGTVGIVYSQTLTETGGTPPYTWSIKSGSLPPGLVLAADTGILSGTPTAALLSNFTVQVKDSESTPVSATAILSLTIDPGTGPALLTPTVTASASPASIDTTQSSTISATVAGASGSATPTGTVQFQVNHINLGAPVALSTGTASLAKQSFTATGSYAITANYSGDANYAAAISAVVTLTVTAPAPSLTINPSTITVSAPGASGTTTLTVANFASTSVAFTCAGLPTGAACSAGTLSSSGTATLQITTTGPSSSAHSALLKAGSGNSAVFYASALPGLLAIGGLFTYGLRSRRWRGMLILLLLLSAGMFMTACGGSGSSGSGTNPDQTPTGTSTVTITATAGSQSATTKITLVVQ